MIRKIILNLGFSKILTSSKKPIIKKELGIKHNNSICFWLKKVSMKKIILKKINKPPILGVGFEWKAWGLEKFLSTIFRLFIFS